MAIGIGSNSNLFIPQGFDRVVASGYCTSECTSNALNSTYYVFASLLHAHQTAIALRSRHIYANGTEGKPFDVNWSYDFNFQQTVTLENEIEFNSGDYVIAECYYRTINKTNFTFGGESTTQEMCLSFLYVYPKPKLRICVTEFLDSELETWKSIAVEKGYLNESIYYYNSNLNGAIEYYEDLWTNDNYSTRIQACMNGDQGMLIDNPYITVPKILKEYNDSYDCNDYNNGGYNNTVSSYQPTNNAINYFRFDNLIVNIMLILQSMLFLF